jgi:hypothetical protein
MPRRYGRPRRTARPCTTRPPERLTRQRNERARMLSTTGASCWRCRLSWRNCVGSWR